jgi:hypothetical protein
LAPFSVVCLPSISRSSSRMAAILDRSNNTSFRIAFAMEKEERKLALKMGKTASFYRIIAAFVIA